MRKKLVVYCDDQKRFLDEFIKRHEKFYEIHPLGDTRELLPTIEGLKELPDLVLLDLYHPKGQDDSFEEKKAEAENSLAKLDAQIAQTNKAVLEAWEPRGIEVLKQLREKYSENRLPVVIYTQKGLLLLEDNQLREIEQNGGSWLLKSKMTAETEEIWIDRIIKRALPYKQLAYTQKGYRYILVGSWLLIGLLGSRLFFSSTHFADIAKTAVITLITALLSYLLSPLVGKFAKDQS